MAFSQIPETQYFLVLESSGTEGRLGSFETSEDTELSRVQVTMQKVGAHTGSEQLRLRVYPNDDLDTPIFSSDYVSMSDIDSLTSSSWAGYITFDFNREHIKAGTVYYISMDTLSYTRDDDSYYWAVALDWPDDINTAGDTTTRGAQMNFLGYKI